MFIVKRVEEILRLTEKFPTHDMGRDMKFDKLTVCPVFKEKNDKLYRFRGHLTKWKKLYVKDT